MNHMVIATVRSKALKHAQQIAQQFETLGANVHIHELSQDPKTRPVVNLDDGAIYENAADACRVLGLDEGNMSKHLRGKLQRIAGKRFKYV